MGTERALATVVQIDQVRPVDNSDRLSVATMLGKMWEVVVGRDQFKPGDLAVYFEIDSFLPRLPQYSFLAGRSDAKLNGEDGYRLKTVKLRGQISQGLLIPLSEFDNWSLPCYGLGNDVTEALGVQKWEPSQGISMCHNVLGSFPSFIPKTSEERLQNLNYTKFIAQADDWVVSEKLHGQSATYYLNEGYFGACSRNLELKPGSHLHTAAEQYGLEHRMRKLDVDNLAIQGELIGPKICGNMYELQQHQFYVFSVFDIDTQSRLPFDDMHRICKLLGLATVPTIAATEQLPDKASELLKTADGSSLVQPKAAREGFVIRSASKPWMSVKVISNKWLLSGKEG